MFEKILVATDGFGPATKAVARAAELAQASGAELVVLHAYQRPDREAGLPLQPIETRPGIDAARGVLDTVAEHHSDVKLRTVLRQGDPGEVILEVAEEEGVDLIVVGNKGMTERFHLGSVPHHISHHSPCHLLIVRTED